MNKGKAWRAREYEQVKLCESNHKRMSKMWECGGGRDLCKAGDNSFFKIVNDASGYPTAAVIFTFVVGRTTKDGCNVAGCLILFYITNGTHSLFSAVSSASSSSHTHAPCVSQSSQSTFNFNLSPLSLLRRRRRYRRRLIKVLCCAMTKRADM